LSSLTGFLLPAVISVLLLAIFISHFKRLPLIHAVFAGLRPAVFGLLLAVAWSLSRVCVVNTKGLLLAIMVILSCVFFNVHPFLILLAAGLIGGLWFR
jgi:chromate transporter